MKNILTEIAKSLGYKMFEHNGGVFSTQEFLSLGYPATKPLFNLGQVL